MAEAFFEEEDAPCSAVVVGEGVDLFEGDVELQEGCQVGGSSFVGVEQVG